MAFGRVTEIHQIHQAVVVDAAVSAQADLAGAAGGDTLLAAGLFSQGFQGMGVQLRHVEAFIPGKATAVDALGDHHITTAAASDIDKTL